VAEHDRPVERKPPHPSTTCRSLWHTPVATVRTNTSRPHGWSMSTASMVSVPSPAKDGSRYFHRGNPPVDATRRIVPNSCHTGEGRYPRRGGSRPEFILGPAKGRTPGPRRHGGWQASDSRQRKRGFAEPPAASRRPPPASPAGGSARLFRHLGGDHDPSRMLLMRARAFSVAQRVKSASIDRRA